MKHPRHEVITCIYNANYYSSLRATTLGGTLQSRESGIGDSVLTAGMAMEKNVGVERYEEEIRDSRLIVQGCAPQAGSGEVGLREA